MAAVTGAVAAIGHAWGQQAYATGIYAARFVISDHAWVVSGGACNKARYRPEAALAAAGRRSAAGLRAVAVGCGDGAAQAATVGIFVILFIVALGLARADPAAGRPSAFVVTMMLSPLSERAERTPHAAAA